MKDSYFTEFQLLSATSGDDEGHCTRKTDEALDKIIIYSSWLLKQQH